MALADREPDRFEIVPPELGAGVAGDYRARLVATARGNTVTRGREAA